MSTDLTVGVTAYSVQSAKPTTQYGQLAQIPLKWGAAGAAFQASLAKIPRNATIVSAVVRWHTVAATAGTHTLRIYRWSARFPSPITYARRPASVLAGETTVTNPGTAAAIDTDVTTTIQGMVAGTIPNHGFYATVAGAAVLKVRGTQASGGRPSLLITYTVPPPIPANPQPSDASVSVAKPALLFDADPAILSARVQVDPAGNAAAPAFDSGEVVTTGGMVDLADTAYPGLADGASTFWRVQQRTDGGWSPWSPWVPVARSSRDPLTITSPAGAGSPVAVEDGTPAITWTFGGTQVAWRVRLLAEDGDPIADSGRHAGTDTDWTPPKGLVTTGQRGIVEVTVWDDSDRAATPGDPVETVALLDVVLTTDGTITPFSAVAASNEGHAPMVTVTGHRTAIPDHVALIRDGREVGRWPGVDVMAAAPGGFVATVTDQTPTMNRATVYALRPIVNGKAGPLGATVTYTPRCRGIWLLAVETNESVVLWGDDDAPQSQPELAVVHTPIGEGDEVPVVRRRLQRNKPQGSLSGLVAEVPGYPADVMEARLRAWVEGDAGDAYVLTLGGYTGRVILGDITFAEMDSNPGDGRLLAVSLNWWAI